MNPLKRGVLLGIAGVLGATTIVAVGLAGGGSAAPAATKCTPNPGTYAMEVCATGTFTAKLVATGVASGTVTAAPGTANTLRSFASMAPISGVAVVTFYNADNNQVLGSASWEPSKRGICIALGGTTASPTSIAC
ncbi:hypothetical protein [Actinoplanes rectilineatus]|uniref:hypothetical protein n=1 Tax=Actinoplanes rectilineatus TaxID=113571 RepID=UPI0005F28BAE|nr:hypothetical protein [Actinoplanes rectilineatus]